MLKNIANFNLIKLIPDTFLGNNGHYHKFIIIAEQRTGSSMLRVVLGEHPNILTFDELLLPKRITFNKPGYDNYSKALLIYRNLFPRKFIENIVFPNYSSEIQAVGFKVFPIHLRNRFLAPLGDWLDEHKEIKVIHLTRENYLASYASLVLALETGKFGIKDAAERPNVCVELSYEDCLRTFNARRRDDINVAKRFRHHSFYKLTYEQLTTNFEEQIRHIQAFLGVASQPLEMSGIKKEIRPLREVIQNYDELKEGFSMTEWKTFFE